MKKLAQLIILALTLGLVAACSSPAPTTSAPVANTPAPTNTSAPTETSAPADAATADETFDNSSLVGEWEGIDPDEGALVIEFKSDGRYEATAASGGPTFELTYEMVDADTFLLIDPSGLSEPATVDFVRSGDTLTLTMDGSTLELTLHD